METQRNIILILLMRRILAETHTFRSTVIQYEYAKSKLREKPIGQNRLSETEA